MALDVPNTVVQLHDYSKVLSAAPAAAFVVVTTAFVVGHYSKDRVNILRWLLLMVVAALVVTVYLTVFPR